MNSLKIADMPKATQKRVAIAIAVALAVMIALIIIAAVLNVPPMNLL